MKAYYRFEQQGVVGVISSPGSNSVWDATGTLAITGALENVIVWHVKQAKQV